MGECDGRVQGASALGKDNSKVAVRATVGAAAMEKAMGGGKGGREGDGQGREARCWRRQRLVLEKMSVKFALLQRQVGRSAL